MPKMKHPDSKHTIDSAPDRVSMYETAGWHVHEPAKKAAAPESKKAVDPAPAKKATPAKKSTTPGK